MTGRPTIFTIGHGAEDFATVAGRLGLHDVGVLVDVRSAPYSRYAPEFIKDELSHNAAEFNLGYRWLGDRLGGRPIDPDLLQDGRPDWDAVAKSAGFGAGITELEGLASSGRAALLCAELDPTHCHRTLLVAPELERRGYEVMHILADGSAVRHQPTLDLR